jgi:hypothetical protein
MLLVNMRAKRCGALSALLLMAVLGTTAFANMRVPREVVFTAEQTEAAAKAYPITQLGGTPYWMPTRGQIAKARRSFAEYLRRKPQNDPALYVGNRMSSYRIQYLGYGDQMILLNGFCDSSFKQHTAWQTDLVVVLDGGKCYFQARYAAKSGEIVEFQTNGEG